MAMKMNPSSRFFSLVVFCSIIQFYRRLFQNFLGFILMDCVSSLKLLTQSSDVGFGFVVFGFYSKFYNVLALFFMFLLGLKFFQFNWSYKGLSHYLCEFRVKSSDWRNGFCLKSSPVEDFDTAEKNRKNPDCNCGSSISVSRNLNKVTGDQGLVDDGTGEVFPSSNEQSLPENDDDDTNVVPVPHEEEAETLERCDEDEIFDVWVLRKLVKHQRRRANCALTELEKERMAASSAADEAMAMILRLQNEKSSILIQSNQLQRLADEKQFHDQEVIQSLQWIITRHESERNFLESQLKWCKERLKIFVEEEDLEDQFDVAATPAPSIPDSFSTGSRFEDAYISSLDFDSLNT